MATGMAAPYRVPLRPCCNAVRTDNTAGGTAWPTSTHDPTHGARWRAASRARSEVPINVANPKEVRHEATAVVSSSSQRVCSSWQPSHHMRSTRRTVRSTGSGRPVCVTASPNINSRPQRPVPSASSRVPTGRSGSVTAIPSGGERSTGRPPTMRCRPPIQRSAGCTSVLTARSGSPNVPATTSVASQWTVR